MESEGETGKERKKEERKGRWKNILFTYHEASPSWAPDTTISGGLNFLLGTTVFHDFIFFIPVFL